METEKTAAMSIKANKKRGVILLISMGFIIAIFGLIGIQAATMSNGLERLNKETMITQSNLIYANMQEQFIPGFLNQFVAPIMSSTEGDANKSMVIHTFLSMFENGIPLNSLGIEFPNFDILILKISASSTKLNINNFKDIQTDEQRDILRTTFEQYFVENQIDDPTLFFNLVDRVLETNSSRDEWEYLANDESYSINSPFFRREHIYDMEHFQEILQIYVDETNNTRIYKLPWADLIQFEESTVEFCKMSPELRKIIFPYQHEIWLEEDILRVEESADSLTGFGIAECNQEDYNSTKEIQEVMDVFQLSFQKHSVVDCELYIANDTVEYEYHFKIDLDSDSKNSGKLIHPLAIKL